MPDEKCGPVEEMTMARALALPSISATISGSSRQNAGFMLLRFSGRVSMTCATRSWISTLKLS